MHLQFNTKEKALAFLKGEAEETHSLLIEAGLHKDKLCLEAVAYIDGHALAAYNKSWIKKLLRAEEPASIATKAADMDSLCRVVSSKLWDMYSSSNGASRVEYEAYKEINACIEYCATLQEKLGHIGVLTQKVKTTDADSFIIEATI